MTRTTYLARNPRRTLGALAAVLAAVGVVVGSGAAFTASSANPSNTFSAGTLSIANSANSAILTASGMRPGDPVSTGTVDIQNTGSGPGTFTLSRGAPADSNASFPMSGKLNLTVVDCGVHVGTTAPTCGDADDSQKYSGTLAAMTSAVELSTFAASEKRRYQFKVSFDSSAGNDYQGASSTTQFTWNAS